MKVGDIVEYLESFAPPVYQESYDNAGLIVGYRSSEVSAALITLDVTEEVIAEALEKKCGLIISHHPILFRGIKRLTGSTYVERCLIQAVKNDLAIFAAHTNLDSVAGGVNTRIAEKIGLTNTTVLDPAGKLFKLVTFIPKDHLEKVQQAIFSAGAGHIGKYDQCSYRITGSGTFRGSEDAHPFAGIPGAFHIEEEVRFETVVPLHLKDQVIKAMLKAHPYEEVAYDIYPLENSMPLIGSGLVGEFTHPKEELFFLQYLMEVFECKVIRHTRLLEKPIRKVALCGGSGSFLLPKALAAGADVFVTADFKYHEFYDAEDKILIADIGHFESEQFTKELFFELLIKKFPNFALRLSEIKTNPVSYLIKG